MKPLMVFVVVIMMSSGCVTNSGETENITDETQIISENSRYCTTFDNVISRHIHIELTVVEGGNVDLYLLDYDGYKSLNNLALTCVDCVHLGSEENTRKTSKSLEVPRGTWYVVVDNTDYFGVNSKGDVIVNLRIWIEGE